MIEAWLILPALALTYLVVSRTSVRSRIIAVVAMGAVVVVVSLSWMTVISLTPASQRPYVDGSQNDSIFSQVFDYNGFGRVGQLSPNQELGQTLGIGFLLHPHRARQPTGSLRAPTGVTQAGCYPLLS